MANTAPEAGPHARILMPGYQDDDPRLNHHVLDRRTVEVSPNGRLIKVVDESENGEPASGQERYGINWTEVDQITGRILTLCDATFSDPEQRKAFKDMVRQQIKEWVTAIIVDSAADAGAPRAITAPFVGGVFDNPELFWGLEGKPTR